MSVYIFCVQRDGREFARGAGPSDRVAVVRYLTGPSGFFLLQDPLDNVSVFYHV